MASRRLSDLNPVLRPKVESLSMLCRQEGIDIIITCTYRSNKEQESLYAQGRTTPGKIVTNAKPGESKHNHLNQLGVPSADAFDVVPIRDGKPVWDAEDPVWQKVGELGESLDLEWAGRWEHMREYPHFQLKG